MIFGFVWTSGVYTVYPQFMVILNQGKWWPMILPDEVTIMAGNVVTKEMTEELIFSGADVIKAWQLIQNHAR